MASRRSTERSTSDVSRSTCSKDEKLTSAGHIHHHIDIDGQEAVSIVVNGKLGVWPSPDVLPKVVEHQEEGQEEDGDREESSRL